MKRIVCIFLAIATLLVSCENNDDILKKLEGELAGGETTVFLRTSKAFGTPAPNLSDENLEKHMDGDAAFEAIFVSHPAQKNGGLGPIFNNNSCVACHPADARASVPDDVNGISGFFYRISIPGNDGNGGPNPVPGFGTQLQHQSLYGYIPEAKLERNYSYKEIELSDGTMVVLQVPDYRIIQPYMSLPADVQISPRIGMPVFGLGLLEAIKEEDILSNTDPDDLDGDSISGKANYVWDAVTQSVQLGRFGWKAGAASILAQSAGAYSEDMGLTTNIHPVENSFGQSNGDTAYITPEVSDEELELVTFYCLTLGVPAARNLDDAEVIKGYDVFKKLNCIGCHTQSFTTGLIDGLPELSNQKIYPYTDMLLHDMGEDLADNRGEFLANGREWKTRPLWGIGLTAVTSGHTSFLHDGRARNVTEAILWHGGEAEKSKKGFIELSTKDREALLKFINSL